MPLHQTKKFRSQAGQTLIETIVAIFVLTMSLLTSLGLTIYVLANSDKNTNEIIATNLAREGVEVVRMMRDTNWLGLDALANRVSPSAIPEAKLQACSDIGNKLCYPYAHKGSLPDGARFARYGNDLCGTNLGSGPNLCTSTDGAIFTLNVPNGKLTPTPSYPNPSSDFVLLKASPAGSGFFIVCQNKIASWGVGYGNDSGDGTCNNLGRLRSSNFYRSIEINHTYNGSFPSNDAKSNAEIVVKATVAWTGKACPKPSGSNPPPSTFRCKVTVEEHLTNWKDY